MSENILSVFCLGSVAEAHGGPETDCRQPPGLTVLGSDLASGMWQLFTRPAILLWCSYEKNTSFPLIARSQENLDGKKKETKWFFSETARITTPVPRLGHTLDASSAYMFDRTFPFAEFHPILSQPFPSLFLEMTIRRSIFSSNNYDYNFASEVSPFTHSLYLSKEKLALMNSITWTGHL